MEISQQPEFIEGLNFDLEFVARERAEEPVYSRRQFLDKFVHFKHCREDVRTRHALEHALAHDRIGVAIDHFVWIEIGCEEPADFVEVEECLSEHREFGGGSDSAVARDPRNVNHDATHFDIFERRVLVPHHHIGDLALKPRFVELLPDHADVSSNFGCGGALPFYDGEQQTEQPFLHRRFDTCNHPEVD